MQSRDETGSNASPIHISPSSTPPTSFCAPTPKPQSACIYMYSHAVHPNQATTTPHQAPINCMFTAADAACRGYIWIVLQLHMPDTNSKYTSHLLTRISPSHSTERSDHTIWPYQQWTSCCHRDNAVATKCSMALGQSCVSS